MSLHLPLTMGDALDLWLAQLPAPNAADCRTTPLAWWLLRSGPLVWRGWVVTATPEWRIELRSIHLPPYDGVDVRSAYMTPIPCAWNEGGVQ